MFIGLCICISTHSVSFGIAYPRTGQCEGLTSGMSDEIQIPALFCMVLFIYIVKSVSGICGIIIVMRQKTLRIILSLLFFVVSSVTLSAQSDIVPTGGTATGNGGTVTYTVGQIAVQTYSNGTFTISEGVQQPYEIQTIGIDNYPGITLNAMVYPNPTVGNVQLTINNEQLEGEVKVFDMNGKFLFSKRIERQNIEIPMSDLAAGTYFVNVLDGTQVLKTFKVVKMAQ